MKTRQLSGHWHKVKLPWYCQVPLIGTYLRKKYVQRILSQGNWTDREITYGRETK